MTLLSKRRNVDYRWQTYTHFFNNLFDQNRDTGSRKFDGSYDNRVSTGRTSHNAWCQRECLDDPVSKSVMSRIENVTGIPSTNYEHFQILRYEDGQKYDVHHDFISYHVERQCGPRILTFFLYLSDVEEGGGTRFPDLGANGLTVLPKKGKALLWPSVLNEDPIKIDGRTRHAALPVVKGTKFAANAWIHLRDFVTPHDKGCA